MTSLVGPLTISFDQTGKSDLSTGPGSRRSRRRRNPMSWGRTRTSRCTSSQWTQDGRLRRPRRPLPPRIWLAARATGTALVLHALVGPAHAIVDTIPADRQTLWSPGIPGGIPSRTTICATVRASTYGHGTLDATNGIQAAIDMCPVGQVVQLSAGEFTITSPLLITKGIVLRGQGPTQTKLRLPVGTNANLITVGTRWFQLTQPTDLASDATKGSRSLFLNSPPDFAVGELVLVDQLSDPSISQWSTKSPPGAPSRGWFMRPNRPVGQVLEVASVRGSTVTFTTPFHIDMKRAFGAQLARFSAMAGGPPTPAVKYAGVEDLYMSGGSNGQGNVRLANAAYSWIKNIESDYHDGASVALDASFRCILRDSYLHSTQTPQPGGGGYGISLAWHSADNLVENNIVWNMNKVMVMRASGGGNVVSYNYMDDGWIRSHPSWVEVGLNASHMTTPHHELFEGNESFNFDGDNTWGNAVFITVFRNHLTAKRRSLPPLQLNDVQNRRAIGLMAGHWWYTFVGNVLGTADQHSTPFSRFRYEDTFPWHGTGMWRLGYNPENWNAPADSKVLSTTIRGGNFDYATRSVHWEDISPQNLPSSLYLASKPDFFGSNPWPWVDPTGPVPLHTLPARQRFDQLMALHRPSGPPHPLTVAAPHHSSLAMLTDCGIRLYREVRVTARRAFLSLPLIGTTRPCLSPNSTDHHSRPPEMQVRRPDEWPSERG